MLRTLPSAGFCTSREQGFEYFGNGYSAWPVAVDGKAYLSSEDQEMIAVRARQADLHIATNPMSELLMATPALSEGVIYLKIAATLFATGNRRWSTPTFGREESDERIV